MGNIIKIIIIFLAFVIESCFEIAAVNEEFQDTAMAMSLDEIVVKASNVTYNATGYRIRLKDSSITIGKSTVELFNYLPNLSVESDVIKINGLKASNIYIDGRKIDNLAELKSLSAEMINSIEIKYTSDAGEIADTAGGTIYIKLKKLSTTGYYGNIQSGISLIEKNNGNTENLGGVIRARIGKVSLYDSPYLMWMNHKEYTTQVFSGNTIDKSINLLDRGKYNFFSNAMSLNYDINNRNTMGMSWSVSYLNDKTRNIDTDIDQLNLITQIRRLSNYVTLRYKSELTEKDNLTVNGEWMNRDFIQRQKFSLDDNTKSRLTQGTNIYQFNVDYQRKFNTQIMSNVGMTYKAIDLNTNENQRNYDNYYKQNIFAQTPLVYASVEGTYNKLSYYAAINWQLNKVKVSGLKSYQQNAWNPTAQISYLFGGNRQNQLMFVYKHILDNIPYDALSDKKIWSDPYNYSVGNPHLKAPTEHYLSLILSLINNTINLSTSYTYDVNTIFWQTFTEEFSDINYVKPINVGGISSYVLRAEFNKSFFKYWNLKVLARIAINSEKSSIGNTFYNKLRLRQYYSISNSLNFNKGWGGYANFFIEPTFHDFDRTYYTVCQLSLGLYKTLFNKKLQIIASCTPINKRRVLDRHSDQQAIRLKYTTPSACGNLKVVWYFNGGKKDINVNVNSHTLEYQEMQDSY